jgi:hypothetical protein
VLQELTADCNRVAGTGAQTATVLQELTLKI